MTRVRISCDAVDAFGYFLLWVRDQIDRRGRRPPEEPPRSIYTVWDNVCFSIAPQSSLKRIPQCLEHFLDPRVQTVGVSVVPKLSDS